MRKKALSEICEILIGRTPSRSVSEYWGKGHKWVSISDMKEEVISSTKEEITEEAIQAIRCRRIPKGTLLLSFKLSVGKLAFAGTDLYTNEAIAALVIKDPLILNSKFLYYALKTIKFVGGNQAVMGITLNSKSLSELMIPIPPLDDQIRIATVLTRAEKLISKRKESIKALDELLKSTFLEMFGDPVRNEKGWEKKILGDVTYLITDGKHGDSINEENSGYYFISAKDIHDGIIDYTNARQIIQKDFAEVHRRTNLCPGDLVVVNTGATIGKLAIAKEDSRTQKTTFQKSVAVIKLNKEFLNVNYLKFLFGLRLKDLVKTSTGSAQQNLLLSQMRKIAVTLPPIALQTQFATIVEKVESLKSKYIQSLTELEKLYGSLSQRAFKGELDLSGVVVENEDESGELKMEGVC